MKKTTLGILIFLLLTTLAFSFKDYNKTRVLKVADSSHIYLDINKNSQIDDDELIKIYAINTFLDSIDNKQYSDKKLAFFLDYFGKKYSEKILTDAMVKAEKVKDSEYKIILKNSDFSKQILSEGLAITNNKQYSKFFNTDKVSKLSKEASEKQYVIYNLNNRKYHKLDCHYGTEAYNFKLVALKDIPKDATQCRQCFALQNFKSNQTNEQNPVSAYKIFGNITVYFLNFNNLKPHSKCSSSACRALIKEINASKHSIDFAIYGINKEPEIITALKNASKRGVKIRWVCDHDNKPEDYYPDTKLLMQLIPDYNTDSRDKIAYKNKKDKNAIMHNKFFIFDNQKVWTGSANITNTDLSEFNANYAVMINSKAIAKIYQTEFDQLLQGNFHNLKQGQENTQISTGKNEKISVFYSPQDKIINSKIIPLIDTAKTYIHIPIFYFTHKDLAQHLISAKKRGVDVKIITDSTNAHGKYTIHKEMRRSGIEVKTENKAGKMHMKTIIIDDKYAILGSMNFTKSGEGNNDENVLIIESREISQYLKQTFLEMWKSIPEKYLHKDPRAEAPESIGSCSDGIDNDFDGLIDLKDTACTYYSPAKIK